MRIGYFADGQWAHKSFEKIIKNKNFKIVFVVLRYSSPDKILKKMAEENNIPVYIYKNINSLEFQNIILKYQADLFVSMSFDQIFREKMINFPKYKTINCHAGKLPFYRGRNVLNWVLINDEKEFGITVHYVDEGIDTGDIILQKVFPISDEDNYQTLLDKSYKECANILYKAIELIYKNKVKSIRQKDIDAVGMYCGKRQKGDEIIDWNLSSREIFNFVRALCCPGPKAISWINGIKIYINKVRIVQGAHCYKNIPGQIIGITDNGFYVKTGDSMLEVLEYSYDGKIKIGDRLKR
ncbi:MAG: methionyl-tRNA formyltransferase [Lachnospiraceae bacterium]